MFRSAVVLTGRRVLGADIWQVLTINLGAGLRRIVQLSLKRAKWRKILLVGVAILGTTDAIRRGRTCYFASLAIRSNDRGDAFAIKTPVAAIRGARESGQGAGATIHVVRKQSLLVTNLGAVQEKHSAKRETKDSQRR